MELKKNPDCKIAVTGYGNSCLTCQQTSWDRTYSVIKYLREWVGDSTRFVFAAAQDGGNPLKSDVKDLISYFKHFH